MTKIPSVEEFWEKLEPHGEVCKQSLDEWLTQNLTAQRTAILTELGEWVSHNSYSINFGWKETPSGFKSMQSPDVIRRIIDTPTLQAHINNLINPGV